MGYRNLSAHKVGGWKAQYERMLRWHRHLQAACADQEFPIADLDVFLAFAQNCYALRDWLKNDGAVSEADLAQFMASAGAVRVCRDVANGSKHLTIDPGKASIDSAFSIGHEYMGAGAPTRLFIIAETDLVDVLGLAGDAAGAWTAFLQGHGLV